MLNQKRFSAESSKKINSKARDINTCNEQCVNEGQSHRFSRVNIMLSRVAAFADCRLSENATPTGEKRRSTPEAEDAGQPKYCRAIPPRPSVCSRGPVFVNVKHARLNVTSVCLKNPVF